jgi:hypothetical protein
VEKIQTIQVSSPSICAAILAQTVLCFRTFYGSKLAKGEMTSLSFVLVLPRKEFVRVVILEVNSTVTPLFSEINKK